MAQRTNIGYRMGIGMAIFIAIGFIAGTCFAAIVMALMIGGSK